MNGNRLDKPRKKSVSKSHVIAFGVLLIDAIATLRVLDLCEMAIVQEFDGALPYLTALIGALQATTAVVLSGYYHKSCKENTCGGITYDTAMKDYGGEEHE